MVAAGFTGGQAEELRRAMGFKRSEKRMKQIEVQLRDGMARQGHHRRRRRARSSRRSRRSRCTAFPNRMPRASRCSAYASAYLKVHYPAAFYTALLNNQPMGFYHPPTLVKDAQRRGVRFHPDRRAGLGLGLHAWRRDGAHPPRAALRERAAAGDRQRDRPPRSLSGGASRGRLSSARARLRSTRGAGEQSTTRSYPTSRLSRSAAATTSR